ncbi:restriction endonuclease subunit S [Gordonia alkaliphila]|uniref:restriction endonuclease subunit S n=1 Tax=Gordonia alkaliphila TaxID=1053547 RepID=UPI001FF3DDA3|nr:restriction endonuclease subunit S [Gordonia alkaliphila]MCK0439542.1 restriction endonuclease subunit S [Gordonia alkaliphila]
MTWPLVKLGDIAEWGSGGTPPRSNRDYFDGQIPWAAISDLTDGDVTHTAESITDLGLKNSSAKIVYPGSLLVAMYGSIGKLGIPSVPMATNQAIAFAIPGKSVDLRFLYHYFLFSRPQLIAAGNGGTQSNISQTKLKNWMIPLPPLTEQRRIAAILDQANSLRSMQRHTIEELSSLRSSIFDEMFGNPSSNKHSFPTTTIGQLADSVQYGTSEKSGHDGAYPVLGMGNITSSGLIDATRTKRMDLASDKVDRFTLRRGDLLFNRTNSPELVGKAAVYESDDPAAYAGYLIRVRTNDDAEPHYVSGYLNSRHGKATLRNMCKAIIGMANINATELRSVTILDAPAEKQHEYANAARSLNAQRSKQAQRLKQLDALFSSLQSRAFRGEL